MPAGGDHSTFFVTGVDDVLGGIGGFFTGPPGDPGRIRQIANQVNALNAEFTRAALALDDAVLTLTQSWTGTAATSFRTAWCACTSTSPSTVLSTLAGTLTQFSRELRDYAKLEHAQHEHWIQLGLMAALTIANAAQLGADPVTDAAKVGVGAGMEVAAGLSLSGLGNLALDGALTGFGSDVFSQLGADLLDWTDPQFDQTGDDVVPLFDPGEAAQAPSRGRSPGSTTVSGGGLGREGRSASSPTTASKPTRQPIYRRTSRARTTRRRRRRSTRTPARTRSLLLQMALCSLSSADNWGNPATLATHFADHGADFGASSADEYASHPSQFLQRGQAEGLPTRIDANGVIRTYDPTTNEFGAFNADGTTRTYFTPDPAIHGYPTNWDYWLSQSGVEP